MKSPGVIYRRYRQLRKKLLYEKAVRSYERTHQNCIYGKTFEAGDDSYSIKIRLCYFHLMRSFGESSTIQKLPELCTCPSECNAFAYALQSKEELNVAFEKEQDNHEYPMLDLMEWILDKNLTDARKKPSIINRCLVFLIILLERVLKMTSGNTKQLGQPTKEE